MRYPQGQQNGMLNAQQLQDTAFNVVYFVCSVISMPVDIVLRPWYGTRYHQVAETFFSSLMMILLPAFSALATGVAHSIPFVGAPAPPTGMFDIGSLSQMYFLLMFVHGIRTWRRMIHMEREDFSEFEGPPLPFFKLFPKSGSFWFTRIVLEPVFVFIASTILTNIFIFSSGLSLYLHIAAFCLLMKSFCAYYKEWEHLRITLDLKNVGPHLAEFIDNQASEHETPQIFVATIPKHTPPEIASIAEQFSQKFQPKEEQL
jgi:hypothetical protein